MKLPFLALTMGVLLSGGAAHAIMLGGVAVPKEKFIVFILIGHSNMSGENHYQSDGVGGPRIWYYQWYGSKTWLPAKEPPRNPELGLSGRNSGGPGMPFLKQLAEIYPDYHFGVISNATVSCTVRGLNSGHNGSEVPASENRYWKGAGLYQEVPIIYNQVKGDFTLGGMICMLGTVEATRTSRPVCEAFSDDVAQMVKDYRADLGAPDMPFVMGEYEAGSTGDFSLEWAWPKVIDQQIKLLPTKLAHSATVNSVGIQMKDDHHYSIAGMAEFARRTIQVLRDKKWLPAGGASVRLMPPGKLAQRRGPVLWLDAGVMAFSGPGLAPKAILTDGRRILPAAVR